MLQFPRFAFSPRPRQKNPSRNLPQRFRKTLAFGLAALLVFSTISFNVFAKRNGAPDEAKKEQATFNSSGKTDSSQKEFVPGQVLVRYRSEAIAKSKEVGAIPLSAKGRNFSARVERFDASSLVRGLRVARVPHEDTLNAVEALNADPEVLYAEPDYIMRSDAIPNDLFYSQLWGLKNNGQSAGVVGADIDAEPAWNITTGSSSVVVGIIDTGIDINHPDLKDNIWVNPGESGGGKETNGIDDDANGKIDDVNGWNFINNTGKVYGGPATCSETGDPVDDHGTHVAGTIGASGNNSSGVTGINWQVKMISLKYLGPCGEGDSSDAISAINYAVMMRNRGVNIRVLNNSWGSSGFSRSLSDAIQVANGAGILFVAAAGNNSSSNDFSPHYPSNYDIPNIISVAATDRRDNLSGFSNFGINTVHIGAPGSAIYSTIPGNSYEYFSGTSMATPHVSGVAALICAQYPGISLQQLRSVILYSGDSIPALENKTITGRRLNAYQSLLSAGENDLTPPGAITNLHVSAQTGRSVTLAWTAPGDDGNSGTAALYDISFTDSSGGAPFALKKAPAGPAGSPQAVTVTIPYRHTTGIVKIRTFDNAGNESVPATVNIAVDVNFADPYIVTESAPSALSTGGERLPMNGDDKYYPGSGYSLPFGFSYFGRTGFETFTSLIPSTNGALYFFGQGAPAPPTRDNGDADDVPGSIEGLNRQMMIAGMWDDLIIDNTVRPNDGVYVVHPNATTVIFRWQGVTFDTPFTNGQTRGEQPINFEIELHKDGTIIMRYGAGQAAPTNTRLFPVVGISNGEPDAYVVTSHTSPEGTMSLTNAQTVTFTPRVIPPPPHTHTISGRVTNSNGAGLSNVKISVQGSMQFLEVFTDSNGYYSAPALTEGNNFVLTPSYNAGYSFVPGSQSFTNLLSDQTSNFIVAAAVNPIDENNFFVRQHYLDFLDREPEADGFNYWTNILNGCGTDFNCLNSVRVEISSRFFIELEFQRTGYFVMRMYQASYGVPPTYAEFIADRRQVQNSAASQKLFAAAWVQRSRFLSKYPATLTPAQFVTQLYNAARITDPAAQTAAEQGLINKTKTRADVVWELAERADFQAREYNPAFVRMMYFGYLRREVETAGFNYWMNVLTNLSPNNYRSMICGFVNAGEYQLRFNSTRGKFTELNCIW